YWAPTSLLVKYPMVRLEMAHDDAEWARCTSKQDCPDPKPNYWKQAEMVTLASSKFTQRDDVGPVKDYLAKRSWTQAEVGKVMLWMTDNQANGEDGAKWFIKNMPEVWTFERIQGLHLGGSVRRRSLCSLLSAYGRQCVPNGAITIGHRDMDWLFRFPQLDPEFLLAVKRSIDGALKARTRGYGQAIEDFFYPLLRVLVFFEST
ncbi:MAG: hypothetical protein E5W45_05665, partial [Mesorhizobium sp.]